MIKAFLSLGMEIAEAWATVSLVKTTVSGRTAIMPEPQPGKEWDKFYDLAESLKVHPYKPQILIEIRSEDFTLEKALEVLEKLNIRQVEHQVIENGNPAYVLLLLSNEDMREAVFKLTEVGFNRVKGVNPEPEHGRKRN